MCMHCYALDLNRDQYTEPLCATPRSALLSRQTGWLCGGCGHWHPYPRPEHRKEAK